MASRTIMVTGVEIVEGGGHNLVELALHFDEKIGMVSAQVVGTTRVAQSVPVDSDPKSSDPAIEASIAEKREAPIFEAGDPLGAVKYGYVHKQ
jgi:hypothetical protein